MIETSTVSLSNEFEKLEEELLLVDMYIQSLPDKKNKAYLIAKSHLGSTFNITKSVGFLSWKKDKKDDLIKPDTELKLDKELEKEKELKNALEKVQEKIKIKTKKV